MQPNQNLFADNDYLIVTWNYNTNFMWCMIVAWITNHTFP